MAQRDRGQLALHDAIRGTLTHTTGSGEHRKEYRLRSTTLTDLPTIVFRPRGWHLIEKHMRYVDRAGVSVSASASLVDFGLYLFHNAHELVARGRGPYFYLPKLEGHREARLWNDVFVLAQEHLGLPQAPSAPRCSSRRCPRRSRWTRSSTSCATTAPG